MTERELYKDIRRWCEQHADPALVEKYGRYFREGYDAYGLDGKRMQEKAASILDDGATLPLVLKMARLLVASKKYEETMFAVLLVKPFGDSFTRQTFDEIAGWFELGIVNWAHTDVLCGQILSRFLVRDIVGLDGFSAWRSASNKYQRRAVPVTILDLLPSHEDFPALFAFLDPLMTDPERVVHQGMGWFLREAWKLKREETESFLYTWKDDAPRLIYQYATEKMTKEEKQRFKREKRR